MSRPTHTAHLIGLGAEQSISYPLEIAICTIGRSPHCQLCIPLPTVSRLHARVERDGAHYLLTDIGSINGTYLNGRRLAKPHRLLDGDLIGLGSAAPILRFEA